MASTNYFPNRETAIKRDGYKCTKCGSSEKVVVHHIDDSRKNGFKNMNNDLDNLTTLCYPCHANAHNYVLAVKTPRIELIWELYTNGMSLAEVGKYIGLSRQRISKIISKAEEIESSVNDIVSIY